MIGYLLLAIAVAELIVGLYLIFRYERSQSTIYYGLFAISIAVYVGANGLGFTLKLDNEQTFERIAWAGGMLTAPFILGFSKSFPLRKTSLAEHLPVVLWPVVLIICGLAFSNIFLKNVTIYTFEGGYQTPYGEFFWFMLVVFGIYWLWALVNLFRTRSRSDGFYHQFLNILLVGIISSLVISAVFDITLPLIVKSPFGFVGSLFSSVWLLVTSYLMLRK